MRIKLAIVLFSAFLCACKPIKKEERITTPDIPAEYFDLPEGFDSVAYPKIEDHEAFTSALSQSVIPFKYQIMKEGYTYVFWDISHTESVKSIQEDLFGKEPGNYNQGFPTQEAEDKFKKLLTQKEIKHEVITYRSVRVVVWSEGDNKEVEKVLLNNFGIDKQAIRDGVKKTS